LFVWITFKNIAYKRKEIFQKKSSNFPFSEMKREHSASYMAGKKKSNFVFSENNEVGIWLDARIITVTVC